MSRSYILGGAVPYKPGFEEPCCQCHLPDRAGSRILKMRWAGPDRGASCQERIDWPGPAQPRAGLSVPAYDMRYYDAVSLKTMITSDKKVETQLSTLHATVAFRTGSIVIFYLSDRLAPCCFVYRHCLAFVNHGFVTAIPLLDIPLKATHTPSSGYVAFAT